MYKYINSNQSFSILRLVYVSGQGGHLIQSLCFVHINNYTPVPAVLLEVDTKLMLNIIKVIILFNQVNDVLKFSNLK